MNSSFRSRLISAVLCVMMLIVMTSCSGEDKKTDMSGDHATVTSDWEYYSLKTDSDTYYRSSLDSEEDLPYFRSEDGETCELSLVKGKSYRALIEDLGDGNYRLIRPGAEVKLDMKIDGKTMQITFPEGKVITFVAE